MGKKDTSKPNDQNFLERDIDPAVASRVEKIMNDTQDEKSVADSKSESSPQAAPLLPSDKLPQTIKKLQKDEKNPEPKLEEPTDDNVNAQGLENNENYGQDSVGLEDPATERAVDEIVNEEADRILAIEDAKAELLANGDAVIAGSFLGRIRNGLSGLWSHKSVKALTILFIMSIVTAAAAIPQSRYFVLNALGVRASTSMTILDEKTRQPLKDVEVVLQNQTAKTDKEGYVSFSEIKLGESEIIVQKPAFASIVINKTLGWGSNPLGDLNLTAVGSRYTFELTDFLSGKPITKAEAISGQFSAVADDKGLVVLVVEDNAGTEVEIEISAENYRSEKLKLTLGNKDAQKLALTPSRKHAFISKRDGTYDLFTIDVDGKNLKKVFPGTGNEDEDGLIMVNHPTKEKVALVSTRGNRYSAEGSRFNTLTIVDLLSSETSELDESESLQVIDFAGDKLIYIRQTDDKPESNSKSQLVSYDIVAGEEKILASANYFNDALLAQDKIYYSPAGVGKNSLGFFSINPDGSDKQTILAKEAWNIFRVGYDKLHVAFAQDWYEYSLSTGQLDQLDGAPATNKSRIYVNSPDNDKSLWTDERDGKGVLLFYEISSGKDKKLQTAGGLRNPVRWLDNEHITYRISNGAETADYVLSIKGGEARKIQDVTDTAGLDRWYYF